MFVLRHAVSIVSLFVLGSTLGQDASIREEMVSIPTYTFSDPNPITTLVTKPEIYPYHKFDGYSHECTPKDWKVVTLENDFIKVQVLPEVGGKIWGAIEKGSGKDFIYKNEVMKFRNIAMRGPWTSGGIEFNFGLIGHTPSTATPVDYVLSENEDGSVSCTVGTIDLPSRTQWRVSITLDPDKAYFTTKSTWYNPTPLSHPYYNWMTAAAKATDDLTFYIPGDKALHHNGDPRNWPVEKNGKQIWKYKENNFGPNKSYHVVGKYHNFFGGYWHDEGIGFAHVGRQESMPGQKLWLWSLARDGGIWEDLLTDTNGQYAEYQAGRLFNQYFNEAYDNPITEMAFAPHLTDEWEEKWLPIKGTGGITAIEEDVVIHITKFDNKTLLRLNALVKTDGILDISLDNEELHSAKLTMEPLEVKTFEFKSVGSVKIKLGEKVLYNEAEEARKDLKRPLTNQTGIKLRPAQLKFSLASELSKRRRYAEAKDKLLACLALEPDFLSAHTLLAELYHRRNQFDSALHHANIVRSFDTYDFDANYQAGLSYKALGDRYNALDALSFAARSMKYRSAAYAEIAQLSLSYLDFDKAKEDAAYALSFNTRNIAAMKTLLIAQRLSNETAQFEKKCEQLIEIDPLNHFARFERYLITGEAKDLMAFKKGISNEFPFQTHIEVASVYVNAARFEDAIAVLSESPDHPIINLWLAYAHNQLDQPFDQYLDRITTSSGNFVFPYRSETLEMLHWVNEKNDSWKFKYYLALALWGKSRYAEAAELLKRCKEEPDIASFYVSRSDLLRKINLADQQDDLRRALKLGNADWRFHHAMIKYLQEKGDYEEQLARSREASQKFANNYVISLDHAQSLLDNQLYEKCLVVLEKVNVLPAEGAFSGRRIYGRASLRRAIQLYEAGEFEQAKEKLSLSYLYPENLGSGRPFEPDERLIDYFMGKITDRLGGNSDHYYEHVIAHTNGAQNIKFLIFNLTVHQNRGELNEVDKVVDMLEQMTDSEHAFWVLKNWQKRVDPIQLITELTD